MSGSRPSLELPQVELSTAVQTAQQLQKQLESSDIQLAKKPAELNAHRSETDEEEEDGIPIPKDPAVIAMDVAAQMTYLRKLKFQYLEQNAKDRYVKSIVSDIDDAPIVTAQQNKELAQENETKKEKLKEAKKKLAEVQNNIRLLAPMVEQDYQQVKQATDKAALLTQKIIDTRKQLMLLRQTHPKPRLTIPLADQKLADQVDEMQSLSDKVQIAKQNAKSKKVRLKSVVTEVEQLRTEAAEAEKAVKAAQIEDDDSRLVPLYNWFSTSLALQRSIHNLEESHSESENELRLTYNLNATSGSPSSHRVIIVLIFAPDTRKLAAAQISGLEELGLEAGDVVDAHIQANDVNGLIAAILARARAVLNL